MTETVILLPMMLSMFDGGAAAAAEGSGAQGETSAAPGNTRRGKSGETIVYGKQAAQPEAESAPAAGEIAEVQTTSNTLEDRKKAYFDFVNNDEFKDIHTQETQRMINRRFKETKTLEDSLNAQKPIIDMLQQRYKVSEGDMAALQAAIEKDTSYWESAAEEAGLTVEQYQQMRKIERENAELKAYRQRQEAGQQAQAQLAKWMQEGESLKTLYKGFDLQTEVQNPRFLSLLKSGVPVQTAYEVMHMDDIKAGIQRMTASATEKQVTDNIRSKGQRPQENGTSSQSAFTVKDDVRKLSKADRANIAKQAARGVHIEF